MSTLRDNCFALPPGVDWTPVDTALANLCDRLTCVVGTQTVPIDQAGGRILAADVQAIRANPPGANAAVDGYGFAHAALSSPPHRLPLIPGRAAAGAPFGQSVPHGGALRILTGALIPPGVDTVVLEEDTRIEDGALVFDGNIKPGANTRRAGEDVEAGQKVLVSGQTLRPQELGLLAAVGVASVPVFHRLRIGVLSTGDELADPAPGQPAHVTFDANRPMLLALADRWGHIAVDLGRAPDDREGFRRLLNDRIADVDVLFTSGGASAGEEDHVSALLSEAGSLAEWRIALKPGRPLALGVWDGTPVFGLPGNPVAALVCALIFGHPACSLLSGGGWRTPQGFEVPAGFAKSKKPGRREFLRARIGDGGRAEVFASEGSGRVSGLSWATGLVELEDGARDIAPGDPVRFVPFSSFGL